MAIVYVRDQGATLRKNGQRIRIEKDRQIISELLIIDISAVVIVGNIQLTCQVSKLFMEHGIDVFFITIHGKYLGMISAGFSKNIFLKLAQYDRCKEDRITMAKAFVEGKFCNQKAVIIRSGWSENNHMRKFSDSLERGLIALNQAHTMNEIYGIEGNVAKIYFELFSTGLKKMSFERRKKRPAYDPVNAMLNFGYTLLITELLNHLEYAGFEPALGFLHEIHYGRISLACDLIEEFRSPVIDRLVVSLINNNRIKEEDFQLTENGCRFKNESLPKFLESYEDQIGNYRSVIKNQVDCLKKSILEGTDYISWKIANNT